MKRRTFFNSLLAVGVIIGLAEFAVFPLLQKNSPSERIEKISDYSSIAWFACIIVFLIVMLFVDGVDATASENDDEHGQDQARSPSYWSQWRTGPFTWHKVMCILVQVGMGWAIFLMTAEATILPLIQKHYPDNSVEWLKESVPNGFLLYMAIVVPLYFLSRRSTRKSTKNDA